MTCVCLACGLPPALAAFAGAQAPLLQLARVVVVGTSPVGLPNVAGPPMAPRVILVCMELVMLYATVANFSAGVYDDVPRATFFGLTAAAAAVPQLIGAKHRAARWEQHGYTKGE